MPRHKTETLASLCDKAYVELPNMNRQSDKYICTWRRLAPLVSKARRIKSNAISCHMSLGETYHTFAERCIPAKL